MKKYIPEKMVAISRYQNFFPTLDLGIRQDIYARMAELIEEEEAYMAEIEDETDANTRAARPLKFLRQNGGQNSSKTAGEPNKPKIPYAAPRYWAAFILLDAI